MSEITLSEQIEGLQQTISNLRGQTNECVKEHIFRQGVCDFCTWAEAEIVSLNVQIARLRPVDPTRWRMDAPAGSDNHLRR